MAVQSGRALSPLRCCCKERTQERACLSCHRNFDITLDICDRAAERKEADDLAQKPALNRDPQRLQDHLSAASHASSPSQPCCSILIWSRTHLSRKWTTRDSNMDTSPWRVCCR